MTKAKLKLIFELFIVSSAKVKQNRSKNMHYIMLYVFVQIFNKIFLIEENNDALFFSRPTPIGGREIHIG